MKSAIRRADETDAQAIHDIMSAISWINESTKSADGFVKTREMCARGEVVVVSVDSITASMMILRQNSIAASCGYNVWHIPLIATVQTERRRGHARTLVREAKRIAGDAVIQAHPENDKSQSLLASEGFVPVEGEADPSGHPLYEW